MDTSGGKLFFFYFFLLLSHNNHTPSTITMNGAPPPPYAEPTQADFQDWDQTDYKYSFEKPEKPVPSPSYEESFPIATPRYNDPLFTYIFAATILLFTYITYDSYSYLKYPSSPLSVLSDIIYEPEKISKPMKALYTLITISTIVPLLCSTLILTLVYFFPTFFVIIAFLLIPLSMFSMAVTSFIAGSAFSGLMFGAFGFLSLMFMLQNLNRFSFSALMIKLIVSAMTKYPSTIIISFLSSIITAIVSLFYMTAMTIIINSRINKDDTMCPHTNGNDVCVSNTSMFVFLFVIFSGCYIFQVLENVTHVTLSGIFSSWYFFDTAESTLKPKNPSFGSLKRALSYCFGSICFGSLLVSVVQTIRISLQVLKANLQNRRFARNNDDDNNSGENALLLCFLLCIVSILEWIANEFEYWMRWFNRYAYSYLSMYGKPYLQSARDTFEILKYKGIDILINDSLVGNAIGLYSIISMLVTGSTLYVIFTSWNIGGILEMGPEMLIIGGVGGLIICYFIVSSAINVLDVGCVTFMIGLAVDPDAFTRTNAGGASNSSIERLQTWEQLSRYYPEIREKVMLDWPENS